MPEENPEQPPRRDKIKFWKPPSIEMEPQTLEVLEKIAASLVNPAEEGRQRREEIYELIVALDDPAETPENKRLATEGLAEMLRCIDPCQNEQIFADIAQGVSEPQKGRSLRAVWISFLRELSKPLSGPVREKMERLLVSDVLRFSYGVGSNQVAPMSDEEAQRRFGNHDEGKRTR